MNIVDYFGPKIAKCKLSEQDTEALYNFCLNTTSNYNSQLVGNVKEQKEIKQYLQNTEVLKNISNNMERYLKEIDAGLWKSVIKSNKLQNYLELSTAWYNKQVHMESTVLHDHRYSADLVCVIFPKIFLDDDAEYFKTSQTADQKGQLYFIYADTMENGFGKSFIEISPEQGDMIIFPSQLSHYTAPVLGKSYRYSISCNFKFTSSTKRLLQKMNKDEN